MNWSQKPATTNPSMAIDPTFRIEAIAAKIRTLKSKKFHLEATTPLGSYVDSSLEMVKLEETIQLLKSIILAPEVQGLTQLPEHLWQQVELQLRNLPSKKIKVDPFHQYNRGATLFVEEDYIELEDALAALAWLSDSLEFIENSIVESLCFLIQWKEGKLSATSSAISGDAVAGEATLFDLENLPKLEGTPEESERAELLRKEAIGALSRIALLNQSEAIASFSPRLQKYLQAAIRQTTAASWWIKNELRTTIALLLQTSSLIDSDLAQENFKF
ncbi:MAG: hypothetical protein F6J93_26350 [Oscillatoria sp. SIO1A7]|nr:hypothetical protein [Oscillatoria sp. SIO1A7]